MFCSDRIDPPQASIICTPGRQAVPVGLSMIRMPASANRALTASASSNFFSCISP
jgi:hypothetical protein